jgi:YHS domain-containing protein
MKLLGLFVLAAITYGIITVKVTTADETKADSKAPATQATTKAASKPAIVNKKCPISGDDVDPKGKTVTYKGKTIGFCCDDCVEKFNKDPEKYMKDLK